MIMKTNFWKYASTFVLGLAAVVACEEPEPEVQVLPVFPDKVIEKNVESGETVEISFDANLDWEVSIPSSDQNKYWLDDEGIPASKLSGKAGKQTVEVVFSEDVYYDANVVCEVTLSMAGENKVIARLTRLAINRTLTVCTAETTDWGFKKTYNTTPATSVVLATFPGVVEYALPIQVVANYDWTLVLPSWSAGTIMVEEGQTVPETLSGKAGAVVEIMLTGKLSEDVAAGAEGVLSFLDASATDKNVEIPFSLPAFADRLEWTEPSSMTFDATGVSTTPSVGYVLAKRGFVVKALEWMGDWHDTKYADWVTVQIGDADATETSDKLLQNLAVSFSVTANDGDDRCADIFVFPASLADIEAGQICDGNSSTCAVKAEYQKYCVGRLTQAGKPKPYVSFASMPEPYKAELSNYTESQWWAGYAADNFRIPVENQYELVYTDEYSECVLEFSSAYASYKIFDFDFYEVGDSALSSFWLTFTGFAENVKGRVEMDPSKFNNPYASAPESFIVLYDAAGQPLAGICCRYSATGSTSTAFTVTGISGDPAITAVDPSSDTYMWLSSEFSVDAIYEISAPAAITLMFSSSVAGFRMYEITGKPSNSILQADLMSDTMLRIKTPDVNNTEAIIVLQNALGLNVAALIVKFAW